MSVEHLFWILVPALLVGFFVWYDLNRCKHKWVTKNEGMYRNETSSGWKTGHYYDQECQHCGELRQVKL